MKKFLLILAFIPSIILAQSSYYTNEYNKFSIELDGGLTKPYEAISDGFNSNANNIYYVGLNFRYMFNTKFGLSADLGYNDWDMTNNNGIDFNTQYANFGINGVINIANLVDMKDTAFKNFGFLLNAGGGWAAINYNEDFGSNDWVSYINLGISPIYKLSNNISLKANLSYKTNVRQNFTFDGFTEIDSNTIDGKVITAGLGIAVGIGSNKIHADWARERTETDKKLLALKNALDTIKEEMADDDEDGVPNYLDKEPYTTPGTLVNTKGESIDINRNGIPDEFENKFDIAYKKQDALPTSYEDTTEKLLSNGYVNVYFETGKINPPSYSLRAVNFLMQYLKDNPEANAKLVGYADQRGEESFNEYLSLQRAKKIYDILVDSGIEEGRLDFVGNGELPSGESEEALQLQRKVTFSIIE